MWFCRFSRVRENVRTDILSCFGQSTRFVGATLRLFTFRKLIAVEDQLRHLCLLVMINLFRSRWHYACGANAYFFSLYFFLLILPFLVVWSVTYGQNSNICRLSSSEARSSWRVDCTENTSERYIVKEVQLVFCAWWLPWLSPGCSFFFLYWFSVAKSVNGSGALLSIVPFKEELVFGGNPFWL